MAIVCVFVADQSVSVEGEQPLAANPVTDSSLTAKTLFRVTGLFADGGYALLKTNTNTYFNATDYENNYIVIDIHIATVILLLLFLLALLLLILAKTTKLTCQKMVEKFTSCNKFAIMFKASFRHI